MRGPFCEGWPVYHAIYDANIRLDLRRRRERVARLGDLPQPRPRRDVGALERGPHVRRRGRPQDLEGLDARARRRPAPRRRRGAGHLREHGQRRDVVAPLDSLRPARQRDVGRPREPAARPSRHLELRHGSRRLRQLLRGRAGVGAFKTEDGGSSWTPRNKGLRRDWPPPENYDDVGFCVHKLVRSADPAADVPAEPRRRAPLRRRRPVVDRDHRGLAGRLRLRRGGPPARPRDVLRDPGRRRPRPDDARRQGDRLAHARCRLELAADARRASRRRTRTSASCARG